MRKLPILKTLISMLFVLALLILFFAIPYIIIWMAMPEKIPFTINGEPAKDVTPELIIVILFFLIGSCFLVYAIYLFKKTLQLFERKKIFGKAVIKYLDQTGKAIVVGYLICAVPVFLYETLIKESINIEIVSVLNSLFVLGLGLFFMVLSEVFVMAKNIKEENDLTV